MIKLLFISLAALLLGAAVGWRGDNEPAEGDALNQREASEVDVEFAGRAEAGEALGFGAGWRSWAGRVREASSQADLEAVFGDFIRVKDIEERARLALLLAARWAEVDPEGGVRFFEEDKRGVPVLLELLTEWALRDQSAAMGDLERLAGKLSGYSWDSAVEHLMLRAPDAALEIMRRSLTYAKHTDGGLRVLARKRPEALTELVAEIEAARLERGEKFGAYIYLGELAKVFTGRDPMAALEWADGLEGRMRDTARRQVISHWAWNDPIAAGAHFEGKDEASGHSDVATAVLKASMARGDIVSAVEWAASRGTNGGGKLAREIATEMAEGELSVRDAFDAVAGMEHRDSIRDVVFGAMWGRLGIEEFDGAFDALVTAPAGKPKQGAMGGLLQEWAERDLEAAVAAVDDLPSGPARDEVMGLLAGGVPMFQHAVAAFSPADRPAVVTSLFAKEPGKEVPAYSHSAIAESLAEAPATEARAAAAGRLASHWGAFDPEAAMAWGLTLPGGDTEVAVRGAAVGWATVDTFSLSNYLIEMAPGTPRDVATIALVESVATDDPDSAWQWAARIEDTEARAVAQAGVVEVWAAENPETAGAAIDAAEFTAEEREALRAVIRR